MGANTGKLAGGLLLLISVWVGVYWMYEPSTPPIRQDERPQEVIEGPQVPVPDAAPGPRSDANSNPVAPASPALSSGARLAGASPQGSPPPLMRAEPVKREIAVVPPEFFDYTVLEGDTLEGVSRKVYGTAEFAGAITRMNAQASAAKLMTVGRVIRLARDPRNIQGIPVEQPRAVEAPRVEEPKVAGAAGNAPKAPAKGPRTYEVQEGDSLSKIAKRFYDSSAAWERIYEANKATMRSPHDLKVGAVLTIPE